jgi:hypothetical protein
MANATRKRPRTASIKPETVFTMISFLEELPEKEKEDLSLREAIGQMQEAIKDTLSRGYSYEDVAKMLSDKGIKISALTLKNYAPSGKRQAAKPKAKRGRKPATEAAANNGAAPSEKAGQESSKKASKPRGGRTKTAAKASTPSEPTVKVTRGRKPSAPKAETKTAPRKRRQSKA